MSLARPERLGVLGGTFDPIHNGHLAAARQAADVCELDRVLFVPAGLPWQKAHRVVSPGSDRYAMTELAVAGDPRFTASRIELDRPGPSYMADTLRQLRASARPAPELFLIVGADTVPTISSWHQPEEVLRLASVIAVSRPGHELTGSSTPPGVTNIEIDGVDVSSSQCRARVAAGLPIDALVPSAVAAYIKRRRLYRSGAV